MKKRKRLLGLIVLLAIVSMVLYLRFEPSDDFYYCDRVFQTDKEVYRIGDTIELTTIIVPEKLKKEIRIYENFSNMDFHALFLRPCYPDEPDSPVCSFTSIIKDTRTEKNEGKINTHEITHEQPYKHTFYGVIGFDGNTQSISIDFKEYGYRCEFKVEDYDKSIDFGFSGIWYPIDAPIGASLEEFIEFKSIEIIW